MDNHRTLKHLMDTLFGTLELKTWTIYENSSATVCTLRFCTTGQGGDTNGLETPSKIAYKKKSHAQMKRDQQRARNFKRPNTRSQTNMNINNDETEIARNGESIFSNTPPSIEVERLSPLNPEASPFHLSGESPRAASVGSATGDMEGAHIETAHIEPIRVPLNSHSEDSYRTDDGSGEDTIDDDNLMDDSSVTVPFPEVIDVESETNLDISGDSIDYEDGYTCDDMGCGYGPGGRYDGNNENISFCTPCQCYICSNCLEKGRHARHKHFIKPVNAT